MKISGTFDTPLGVRQNRKQQQKPKAQQPQQTSAATIKALFFAPIAMNHLQPIAYGNILTVVQSCPQSAESLRKQNVNAVNVVFKHNELP